MPRHSFIHLCVAMTIEHSITLFAPVSVKNCNRMSVITWNIDLSSLYKVKDTLRYKIIIIMIIIITMIIIVIIIIIIMLNTIFQVILHIA